jgi:alanine racemase
VNHIANTPATLSRPDLRHEMVRPGVSVYGVYAVDPAMIPAAVVDEVGKIELREAMTVRARVVTTRVVPAGEGVSYGHLWRAERDTSTAVVAMGYADGLPRSMSGRFGVTDQRRVGSRRSDGCAWTRSSSTWAPSMMTTTMILPVPGPCPVTGR